MQRLSKAKRRGKMNHQRRTCVVFIVLAFSLISCSFSGTSETNIRATEVAIESTRVALEATQVALDSAVTAQQPASANQATQPTTTPIPSTATSQPDTAAGSILTPDQTWKQEGVFLEVDGHQFYYEYETCRSVFCDQHTAALAGRLLLDNATGQRLILEFSPDDFSLQDDAGSTYPVERIVLVDIDNYHPGDQISRSFSAGERLLIDFYFGSDIELSPRASQVTMRIKRLSKIEAAQWVFDIPR